MRALLSILASVALLGVALQPTWVPDAAVALADVASSPSTSQLDSVENCGRCCNLGMTHTIETYHAFTETGCEEFLEDERVESAYEVGIYTCEGEAHIGCHHSPQPQSCYFSHWECGRESRCDR